MPTSTIELPREMVDAAKHYAASEHRSVTDLFADLMKKRYGFVLSFSVSQQHPDSVSSKRVVKIPDSINSISGIISLPREMSESDIIYDAIMSDEDN